MKIVFLNKPSVYLEAGEIYTHMDNDFTPFREYRWCARSRGYIFLQQYNFKSTNPSSREHLLWLLEQTTARAPEESVLYVWVLSSVSNEIAWGALLTNQYVVQPEVSKVRHEIYQNFAGNQPYRNWLWDLCHNRWMGSELTELDHIWEGGGNDWVGDTPPSPVSLVDMLEDLC